MNHWFYYILIHLYEELQKELVESNKIDWLYEDLQSLVSSTFEPLSTSIETRSKISKNEEINLLNKFNEIVINVSTREKINSTLLFSKKNQKDFIRVALGKGLEEAFQTITLWRKELIQDSVKSLLLQY